MARKTVVHLEDDLDGGKADETVRFSLDGRLYEIDLSEKHATALRESLAQFVAAARPGRPQIRSASFATHGGPAESTSQIRQWARANGYEIGDRGRIPTEILAAYSTR
jgi:hypothetical protein